ncbi:hypothetical protein ACFSQQ_37820 [Mesorhizobium kowhaii]|uniref:Integrase n=1 Tax=Mesorhizobium cantuariense TaxID=1300275 RepID=A0ABV7MEW8_9HYPH
MQAEHGSSQEAGVNRQRPDAGALQFHGHPVSDHARPSDLAKAEFGHFDLEKLVWPKHNVKGIKLPVRSTSTPTVRCRSISGLLGWCRPNVCAGLKSKSCSRVPDHQLYDLKRIAISLMLTGQGVSHEAISHYVDHKGDLETTMIYDLGLIDPLLPATERLGALFGI